jgi:hypothetical protein
MAIKRCGSCRHWEQRTEADPDVGQHLTGHLRGVCRRLSAGGDYPLAAVVVDGAEVGPWLITSEDFGCPAFEPQRREAAPWVTRQ